MTSCCVNPKRKQTRLRPAYLAVAGLAVLIAAGDNAGGRPGRRERPIESIESRSAGERIMAIVSLRDQRITVSDAKGWVRMPYVFAADLFDATAIDMRVIVAPSDVAPVELIHPVLFQPKPGAAA